MIKYVVAVYDKTAGFFLDPMPVRSKGIALRDFEAAIKAGNFQGHELDMELYQIARFDDVLGEMLPDKERLLTGFDFVDPELSVVGDEDA